jgi:hypothetical protein
MVKSFMTPLPASLRISFDCPYGDRLKAELQAYCGSAIEVITDHTRWCSPALRAACCMSDFKG